MPTPMLRTPFILMTYGFSQKLFSYEENGVLKLPIFGEAILVSIFRKSIEEQMDGLLDDKEPLEIQICEKMEHAIDIFKVVATATPNITIVYNAAPIVEDPQAEIGKIANQLQSPATVINREYAIDEWLEELEGHVESSSEE